MGLLHKTRVYLAGNLEFSSETTNWRETVTKELSEIGIICLNPMNANFISDQKEDDEYRNNLIKKREAGDYKSVSEYMKLVVHKDLRLIDIVDFVIFNFEFDKPTYGTTHELVISNFEKKPMFIVAKEKEKVPLWLMGIIPEKYIYKDIDSVIKMIRGIDSGKVIADSNRWRLLKESLR